MKHVRRFLALALLIAYGASSAEAVVGVVRDGSVHHESAAAAAMHHEGQHDGEHGHEDGGQAAEHGSEHQHGTPGDHCTHTHGTSIPTTPGFELVPNVDVATDPPPPLPASDVAAASHFRPPRA
jgi:hypothetical protein